MGATSTAPHRTGAVDTIGELLDPRLPLAGIVPRAVMGVPA